MTRTTGLLACVMFVLAMASSTVAQASPPEPPPPAVRSLTKGGVWFGLALATELTGAIISTTCAPDEWCAHGVLFAWGSPEGPNRFTLIVNGPSIGYVGARLIAAPMVAVGFAQALRGAAEWGALTPSTNARQNRRIGRWLLGSGLGLFIASRMIRWAFVPTGVCQSALCVHGFDQNTLWAARGLMVTGSGFLIHHRASRSSEMTMGPGPLGSQGMSVLLRF